MLVLIVVVVVVGAIFVLGALVGVSVAQNHAGDQARRRDRQRQLLGTGLDTRLADLPARPARSTARLADVRA